MPLPKDPRRSSHGEHENRELGAPGAEHPGTTARAAHAGTTARAVHAGTTARAARAAVPETVDGNNIQVLELRGTIIRLREQLDRVHMNYEEKVQHLESMHRAQRRELENTIRHLRDRLQAVTDNANGG